MSGTNKSSETVTPVAGTAKASVPEILEKLKVRPAAGLTSIEAQSRLDRYGPNALQSNARRPAAVSQLGELHASIRLLHYAKKDGPKSSRTGCTRHLESTLWGSFSRRSWIADSAR